MSNLCKAIIEKNEEIKLYKSIDDIYTFIAEYLKENYNIERIKISLKSNDDIQELFTSNEKNDSLHTDKFEYTQSDQVKVVVEVYYNKIIKKESDNCPLDDIKIILQIFSQSLYNKYLEKSIEDLTLVDSVTGMYNRVYLNNYSSNILNMAYREQKKLGFIKIGIDQFKAVIDEFNYEIGDKILKSLADSLLSSVRSSDIVIKIAGDEFLVILMNVVNENNAKMIAEKIINNFSKEKIVVNEQTNQALMKTICAGISMFPDDASSIDEIIKKSDIALYEARNKGRSKAFVYTEEDTHTIDFF